MKYLIVIEATATGYSAYLPAVHDCIATSDTRDEVEREIKSAIALYVEGLEAEGLGIPEPSARVLRDPGIARDDSRARSSRADGTGPAERLERCDDGSHSRVRDVKTFEAEFMTFDGKTAAVATVVASAFDRHRSGHFAFAALVGFPIGRDRAMQPLADARLV